MRRDARIAVAATLWLLLLVPVYFYAVRVPRVQLDVARIRKLDALASKPLPVGVKIGISSPSIPDLAEASERRMNATLSNDTHGVRFLFGSCSSESTMCINVEKGDLDSFQYVNDTFVQMTYSAETLASKTLPTGIVYLLLNGVYAPIFHDNDEEAEETVPQVTAPHEADGISLRYTPRLHVIFSLFGEGGEPLSWEIADAIDEYLGPLLTELKSRVVDLTVETQVGNYMRPGCARKTIIKFSQLSTFVNFAEWSLSSGVTYPIVNFVLYAPETPMHIENTPSNSFFVARWGGVIIEKPGKTQFYKDELRAPLNFFGKQLLLLLGMREPAQSRGKPTMPIRLDQLAINWTSQGFKAALASLRSLSRLTQTVTTIPVPCEVRERADRSMDAIDKALSYLKEGNISSAAPCVAQAYDYAESAFFDKRMIAQAYFPDDQKLAVYVPLIGPLIIVVLGAWLRLYQRKSQNNVETEISASK